MEAGDIVWCVLGKVAAGKPGRLGLSCAQLALAFAQISRITDEQLLSRKGLGGCTGHDAERQT